MGPLATWVWLPPPGRVASRHQPPQMVAADHMASAPIRHHPPVPLSVYQKLHDTAPSISIGMPKIYFSMSYCHRYRNNMAFGRRDQGEPIKSFQSPTSKACAPILAATTTRRAREIFVSPSWTQDGFFADGDVRLLNDRVALPIQMP